jgi:hypothetical protein
MANILTGDFDAVAQFSISAVNRILAGMHQCERFLHSISARVDDNPPPGPKVPNPVVIGLVDAFGEVLANQSQIGTPGLVTGGVLSASPILAQLGVLVNADVVAIALPPLTPSHISGVVQMQLFPPTVSVPPGPGNYLRVTTNIMARYFPDHGTAPLAQFIRGNLQITAPVNKIATGKVHVLDIDFKAEDAAISFSPTYSSETLSPEDIAGISLCIQNGLRSSFLPSSVMLPSSIADVQLKTLPGVVAILLDFNDHTPASTTASVNTAFIGGDDFAFAIGREYILNLFNSYVGSFTQFQPFSVSASIYGTTTYTITLTSTPTLDLQPGAIVLTIKAHAHSSKSRFPSFNFTTNVSFTLELVATGEGGLNAAQLALASVSLDFTDSGLGGWLKDLLLGAFNGNIKNQITAQVNSTLNPPNPQPTDLQPTIRQMSDADANLGNHLTAQFSPSDGSAPPSDQRVFLIYNSFTIQPAGIVLQGSVMLFDWPAPQVQFEQIPTVSSGPLGSVTAPWGQGKDYSALKSWIPGGTINQYEWSYQGQPNPFHIDPNTFVLLASGPGAAEVMFAGTVALPAYTPLCLTLRGTRISNYGTPTYQLISATLCDYTSVSLVSAAILSGRVVPSVALSRSGPNGLVAITGHAPAQASLSGSPTPNLLIHFADAKSASQLEILIQALTQSKRTDASTAVIAVASPAQLSKTRYTPGLIYAEDNDNSWAVVLGLKSAKRPLTAIVGPRGTVSWQTEGPLDRDVIAAALAKFLVKTGAVQISMPRLNVRIGQPAPNFIFEYTPGREMPLSKLRGQPVFLIFWNSSSKPSLDAVRECEKMAESSAIVLAINSGESADLARAAASEGNWAAIPVSDPKSEISSAYGIKLWPTIVSLDASGKISSFRYGYGSGGENQSPQLASAVS